MCSVLGLKAGAATPGSVKLSKAAEALAVWASQQKAETGGSRGAELRTCRAVGPPARFPVLQGREVERASRESSEKQAAWRSPKARKES